MAKKKDKTKLEFLPGNDPIFALEYLSTGLLPLDMAAGGGFEKGSVNEIYGEPGTFKSVLLRHIIAHTVRHHKGEAYYATAEHDYKRESVQEIYGVDPKDLMVAPVKTIEQFFEWVQEKATDRISNKEQETPCVVGLDSVANIGTSHSTEKDTVKVADKAGAITNIFATGVLADISLSKMTVIAINQVREDLKNTGPYAEQKVHTPCGRAWKYNMTHRVYLQWMGTDFGSNIFETEGKSDSPVIGKFVKGKIEKNRHAPHNATFFYPFYMRGGYPHPVFEGATTKLGIDFEEAALKWYCENKAAVYHKDKEPLLSSKGGGYWEWHPRMVELIEAECGKGSAAKFYKKHWLLQIQQMPQLMDAAWVMRLVNPSSPEEAL